MAPGRIILLAATAVYAAAPFVTAASQKARRGFTLRWGAMVINLDRRPDRLRHFVQSMKESQSWLLQSGNLCRIPGRDGREWLEHHRMTGQGQSHVQVRAASVGSQFERLADGSGQVPCQVADAVEAGWFTTSTVQMLQSPGVKWPNVTAGAAGLYLAHADAWRHLIHQGWDYGLVFEDDLTLYSPDFEEYASKALVGGRDIDWDFLYLQHDECALWKKSTPWPFGPRQISEEQEVSGLVFDTAAYIVSRQGAQKLLARSFPAARQLDAALTDVRGLRRAMLMPPVAQADERVRSLSGGVMYTDSDVQAVTRKAHSAGESLAAIGMAMGLSELAPSQSSAGIRNCT